jgi:hypothetical protein
MASPMGTTLIFLALVPNGEYKGSKMYKILLQDPETHEVHEFFTSDKQTILLELVGACRPSQLVDAVFQLEYDRFNKRSKFRLIEVHPKGK